MGSVGRPQYFEPEYRGTFTGTISYRPGDAVPALPPESPCSAPVRETFLIGQVVVVLTRINCQGNWMTTAFSTAPAVYVQGATRGAEAAAVMRTVMLTIRFTGRPGTR